MDVSIAGHLSLERAAAEISADYDVQPCQWNNRRLSLGSIRVALRLARNPNLQRHGLCGAGYCCLPVPANGKRICRHRLASVQ